MRRFIFSSAITVLLVLCWRPAVVSATNYGWSFQDVTTTPVGGPVYPALGMRTGGTWPTAFYASNSQIYASSLTPVGWSQTSLGSWSNNSPIRSATRSDGQVGVAWQSSSAINFAQSGAGGWYTSGSIPASTGSKSAPDVAYLSSNRPVLAYSDAGKLKVASYDGRVWSTATVRVGGIDVPGEGASIAIDSQDRMYIAYTYSGEARVVSKDLYATEWSQWKNASQQPGIDVGVAFVSLACGPNDEIGFSAVKSSYGLDYAYFSPQTGTWQIDAVAPTGSNSPYYSAPVDLAFNSAGMPAMAYATNTGSGNNIHYRYKVGLGWGDSIVPDVAYYYGSGMGLAFDSADLPVLAYQSYSTGRMRLAYDPIITPEPTSLALLAAGAVCVIRRRKGA